MADLPIAFGVAAKEVWPCSSGGGHVVEVWFSGDCVFDEDGGGVGEEAVGEAGGVFA